MSGEFGLINRFFKPLSGPEGVGLVDDCAYLPAPGGGLVVSTDMLVAGRHFNGNARPDLIAQKALLSNISDVISSGGAPHVYWLSLALPEACQSSAWLSSFAEGLAEVQHLSGIRLAGGDTTSAEHLAIGITALGKTDRPVSRRGANPGDVLALTGTIGGPAFGLDVEQGRRPETGLEKACISLYQPEVPIGFHLPLARFATAALDVSDGLLGDAQHLARASCVGLDIDASAIPFSSEIQPLIEADPSSLFQALTGGDDYQVLFTCKPGTVKIIREAWPQGRVTVIGSVVGGEGAAPVRLLDQGGENMLAPGHPAFDGIDRTQLGFSHVTNPRK